MSRALLNEIRPGVCEYRGFLLVADLDLKGYWSVCEVHTVNGHRQVLRTQAFKPSVIYTLDAVIDKINDHLEASCSSTR